MSDNFEGKGQDLKDKEDDEEGESEEEEEPDDVEMGETETGADKLDKEVKKIKFVVKLLHHFYVPSSFHFKMILDTSYILGYLLVCPYVL